MHKAVFTQDSLVSDGAEYPLSSLKAAVGTEAGTVLVFQDGSVALSALDVYCISDRCPWVRSTVRSRGCVPPREPIDQIRPSVTGWDGAPDNLGLRHLPPDD